MAALSIVTYSSLFPNREMPQHGTFVAERLKQVIGRRGISATVVAPVPWFPSGAEMFGEYGRFARVPGLESWNGVEVHHPRYGLIPKVSTGFQAWSLAAFTSRCLERLRDAGRAAVIDAHYFYPDGVAAAMLGRQLGIPVVITARGSDLNVLARGAWLRRRIAWAARQAHSVVTVSEALRVRLIEMGVPESHVRTLRNGVDLQKFSLGDRYAARRSLRLEGFTLLSVGRLVAAKGHWLVARALEQLPDCRLVIVGEGPERAAIEGWVRHSGLADRVRLTGALDRDQLVQYYQAADALVLASASEGMPNVVLEALACGTPVMATAVGGVAEILASEVGRLMPSRAPEAIVAAVNSIRDGLPDRSKVRRYAERFGWQDTAAEMVRLLEMAAAVS